VVDSRIDELRRRLERDPGSRLFAQLAEEYRKAGDHAEAVRVARNGLAQHPGYASARLTLGRALLESGDGAGARRELEHALREAPDNILASRFLGQALEAVGDLGGALLQYGATLKMAPGDGQLESQIRSLRARLTTSTPGGSASAHGPEGAARPTAPPPLPAGAAGGAGEAVPPTIRLAKTPPAAAAPAPVAARPPLPAAAAGTPAVPAVASHVAPVAASAPAPLAAPPAAAAVATAAIKVVSPPAAAAAGTPAGSAVPPTDPVSTLRPGVRRSEPEFGDTEPARAVPAAIVALPTVAAPTTVAEAASPRDAGSGAAPLSSSTLAELYLRQGLQEQAVEVYRQVLAEDPGNARARARLAEIAAPAPAVRTPDPVLDPRAARRRSLERTIAGLEALLAALRRR
jgi:tetratricopeptide (TPR) repeat protein